MWICRRCAARVKDEVLQCPCCAAPAPARFQPELAEHISNELNETPRHAPINWLTRTTLPSLRKRAQSPQSWMMMGFVFGVGNGVLNFRELLASSTAWQLALLQPFLCGIVLAVLFGLLNVLLDWRRGGWHEQIRRDTYPIERSVILALFLPLILTVNVAFTQHQGWESLHYLDRNLFAVGVIGIFVALLAAIATSVFFPACRILLPLARRLGFRSAADRFLSRAVLTKTDTLRGDDATNETNDPGILDPERSNRFAITDGHSEIQPNTSGLADDRDATPN